ncbi:asparagine synthase-related protein [Streptomyces uncialis]|uniref:Asparagine synthase n=1 Tax=Streptomyces uncialis TaxID=1048205 RepID=A0A1Q4USC5_9ACTN|nr:asparagine synthase-related protein [Streptomyces uncialis]OKH88501.1 asparagine synthase [Streptomyces uncialis]
MLTLRLTPYADGTWRWHRDRYLTGDRRSEIVPVAHSMTEQLAVTDGRRTLLVVRDVSAAEYERARGLAEEWPTDYVLVESVPDEPVQVVAGACRSTPLYLASDADTLHGSWDMGDLRRYAGALNAREATRLLLYRPRYSHDTLFTGIHRLTERSTAYFGGHLFLRYPAPALHSRPRELAPGADVEAAFVQALDDALDLRPLDPDRCHFHLTGGFDSATVATRAAQRFPGRLGTSALLIGGPGRPQQIRRRSEMRSAVVFGRCDELVDALRYLPLHPECLRVQGEPISPYEDPLHFPFVTLAQRITGSGAHAVFTGIGGDEMVALTQEEYPHRASGSLKDAESLPWLGPRVGRLAPYGDEGIAPAAAVNSMTLLSLESAAPVILRAGLWPVHPFADTGMVTLGEALPMDWRELKQLQRRRLASLGMSSAVTHPPERESFAEVVEEALISHGADLLVGMLASGSPLLDSGLIDPGGLRDGVRELRHGAYDEMRHSQLIEVVHLHLAATAYL